MIPIKLELKNFLSYGATVETVDFKDYPLICLSGRNGHGKSALLDAITWSIWGQARKVSGKPKADEGLLRLGQTQMMVSLEFLFNNCRYRVRREFGKTYGKNHTALDFELFNDSSKRFVSLTDKTIRATQAKIETLIKLDFDTFVNSAFLRQGHANEFSNKSPKERKEILSNILGLARFDALKQKAQEHLKKHQDEKKLLDAMQEQTLKELEVEEEFNKKVVVHKAELEKIAKSLEVNQKELGKLEKENLSNLAKKQAVETILKDKDELSKKESLHINEFKKLFLQWRDAHKESLYLPDVAALEKKKKDLASKEKEFRDKQQKFIKLQEEILTCKAKHQKAEEKFKSVLEKEIYLQKELYNKKNIALKGLSVVLEHNQKTLEELEKTISKNLAELKELEVKLEGREKYKSNFEKQNAQFEKRRAFYQTLIQRGNWLQTSLSELEQKKQLARDKKTPSCSLCEQVLTSRRRQFLMQKFVLREKHLIYQLDRVSRLIAKLKEILLAQNDEVKSLSFKQEQLNASSTKKEELQTFSKENREKVAQLTKVISDGKLQKNILEKELAALESQLKEKEEGLVVSLKKDKIVSGIAANISGLEEEKKQIVYDKKIHDAVLLELNALEIELGKLENTASDLTKQDGRKSQIRSLIYDIKTIRRRIAEYDEKLKAYDDEAEKKLLEVLEVVRGKGLVLAKEKEEAVLTLGRFENELKRIEKLKSENRSRLKRTAELKQEINEYKVLSTIFGKDGIQALLIEESIPEIEDEANVILSCLTDNNSQILIESLRDLKKGGVKETLDIKISDSTGIRPYEMFSGGEAFRIDFALRIAISKLLTRRAGTALQTLIIDEGFGSQDEEGLAKLMDAIRAVSKDFSRIIVVSHLTAFKDNFPVHFMVEKFSSGSRLSVSLRG